MGARERAALGFVLTSFALNSVITRHLVMGDRLDPALTTVARFWAGALALALVVALARPEGLRALRPTRAHALPTLALFTYALAISYGYGHIGAAAGTFVFYACVLATMTLAGGARTGARQAAGALLALAGVGVLTLARAGGATPLGVALLALTGTSWGAYSLLGRTRGDPLANTAANFTLLAILLAPLAALALSQGALQGAAPADLALAAAMGAITTALSYAAWYWLLPRLSATQAGTYQMLIPVLAATLAIVLLGEPLSARLVGAGALVVAGMWLATPRPQAG